MANKINQHQIKLNVVLGAVLLLMLLSTPINAKPVTFEGIFTIVLSDDFENAKADKSYLLETTSGMYEIQLENNTGAEVFGREFAGLKVEVTGELLDRTITIKSNADISVAE